MQKPRRGDKAAKIKEHGGGWRGVGKEERSGGGEGEGGGSPGLVWTLHSFGGCWGATKGL